VIDAMEDDYSTLSSVVGSLLTSMASDYSTFADSLDGVLDDYGDSIRSQINTRFDNQLAAAKQGLVDRGMYNSTVWDSIETGLERERSLALSDVADKITQQEISVVRSAYAAQTAMRDRVLAARERLASRLADVRKHTAGAHGRVHAAVRDMRRQVHTALQQVHAQLRSVHAQKFAGQSSVHQALVDMRQRAWAAKDRVRSRVDAVHAARNDANARLYSAKASMRDRIVAARDRVRHTLHSQADRRLASRNMLVEAMTRFMEARTDSYPDLSQIGQLAAALGTGDPAGLRL